MAQLFEVCNRRDRATRRNITRKCNKHIHDRRERVIYVPERDIARYYQKHNFEKQPSCWENTRNGAHIKRWI